jgi:hypothetical protein
LLAIRTNNRDWCHLATNPKDRLTPVFLSALPCFFRFSVEPNNHRQGSIEGRLSQLAFSTDHITGGLSGICNDLSL